MSIAGVPSGRSAVVPGASDTLLLRTTPMRSWILTPVAGSNLLKEKVSRFSELSSEFEFWGSFASNVKVTPVFSWKGQNSFQRIFFPYSQHFNTSLAALHDRRESLVALHDTLHESTPQSRGRNTVKRNLERRIPRKSSENLRLFPGANLIVRPVLRGLAVWRLPLTNKLTDSRPPSVALEVKSIG